MRGFGTLRFLGLIGGLTALSFFALSFWTFLTGQSVTLFESNKTIALTEFIFTIIGLVGLLGQTAKNLWESA